ncbi:MAG TPA: penicillin acylase family protein [Gemmatimonadaceae bacterium]|nr:penicillin acylase family protein [Gemmatimonadaceae bacterium]
MRLVLLVLTPLLLVLAPMTRDIFDDVAKASLARIDGRTTLAGLRDSVEVVRDQWGVPHIYARNIDDLFFAQGFVQAQDRLWQMEMYRRTYEGRLSEILGPAYLQHDRLVRLLSFRGPFDDREWKSYHPEGKRIFDAFARGVNAFIALAGENLPAEFRITGIRPLPWTPEIALLRSQTAMPTSDLFSEMRLAQLVARVGTDSANRAANPSPFRPLTVPEGVNYGIIGNDVIASLNQLRTGVVRPEMLPEFRAAAERPSENTGVQEHSPGSNNWATSAKLSPNGHVIVANDPHRNVASPSIRYIVHLNAPGWNVIGATEAVLPGVMIGHTEHIGWGLTIVGTDQSDVYVETVNPADRNQVLFRGQWERMRVERDTIRIRHAPDDVVTYKFSRHGPVFHEDTVNHRAYVMRSTMHLPGTAGYVSALRYHSLRDCNEFLDAQKYFLAPTENMVCGDTRGNIAWQASAASPKRPNWQGRLPVPGTGEYEWDGLRTDLPREVNPERGWIATANHDIHPPEYDPPLFFKQGRQDSRYRRLAQVFSSGRQFTIADHQALQHDAFNAAGAADVPYFRGWESADAGVERARRALAEWDGQHRRDSYAAALYRFVAPGVSTEWGADVPIDARKAVLEPWIRRAMDSLRTRLGPDTAGWRWGKFNRSQFPHAFVRTYDIPGVERHGGSGFVAAVGATYRQIIDMDDLDASVATNVPGQSGQPGSPFYRNLVDAYGRGEYFPLAFSRAAVERVQAHRLVLTPR